MFKWMVFAYYDYYPGGGMNDCVYKGNVLKIALQKIATIYSEHTYIEIINLHSGERVSLDRDDIDSLQECTQHTDIDKIRLVSSLSPKECLSIFESVREYYKEEREEYTHD